jgi:peroxiredoxin
MRRTLLTLALVAFAVTLALVVVIGRGMRNAGYVVNALAAIDDPYLYDLEGKRIEPGEILHDKIVVWIYTQTDCPVSNRYAPEVRELYDAFHARGVEFYLIYVDPTESVESIRTHLAEYEYPCPALRDPDHTTVHFTKVTVTPEAVVFDEAGHTVYQGRISDLYAELGNARVSASKHDLRHAIEATLDGRPVAEPVTKAIGCYIRDLKAGGAH